MAIAEHYRKNFKTLQRVFKLKAASLVQCRRKSDGKIVAMLCALGMEGDTYNIVPFAEMIDGNPFELYDPPNPAGGFYDNANDCTCNDGGSAGCPVHDEAVKGN